MNWSACNTRKMLLGWCAGMLAATAGVQAEDWNQWRGPQRTGFLSQSPALITELPAAGLEPLWSTGSMPSARGGGWGSPVVTDGTVYLFTHKKELVGDPPGPKQFPWLPPEKRTGMSDAEYEEYERNRRAEDAEHAKAYEFREFVYAFDAISGEQRWVNESLSTYTRFPQSGCPTVIGDRLYILGAGRQARCLETATGAEKWATTLPGEFEDEYYQASVLVVDQIAIFNASHLFGLDIATGKIVWTGDSEQTAGNHASPVAWEHDGQSDVISLARNGHIVCLDPRSGTVHWSQAAEGGQASPVISGNRLLVYGNSRKKGLRCYELTASGASELWRYHQVTDKGSTPVIAGNEIYVQGERKLACVDMETGRDHWVTTLEMENPQYSSPIAAGEVGFFAYDGLLMFDLKTDQFVSRFDAKIDRNFLLASTATFRAKYQLDQDDLDPEARKTALKNYQQQVGNHGPLKCATPAFADGLLFLRLGDAVACYDLRADRSVKLSAK